MSIYAKKILNGQTPTTEDWENHLMEAHLAAPSMTPDDFAGRKTRFGFDSYELLAREIKTPNLTDRHFLDLACGDGHLIPRILKKMDSKSHVSGVDMSVGELNVAKARVINPRVSFYQSKANHLPFPDKTFDHIVCHMAFMLMMPIEPVIKEIGRVLKPGGGFSAVVSGLHQTGIYADIRKIRLDYFDSKYPSVRNAKIGDPRIHSTEGLRELFSSHLGFQAIDAISDFELEIETDFAGIWTFMKDTYFIGMLPDHEKQELKKLYDTFGKKIADTNGQVKFSSPLSLFTIFKKDS